MECIRRYNALMNKLICISGGHGEHERFSASAHRDPAYPCYFILQCIISVNARHIVHYLAACMECIRRYNALMNKLICISGVTVTTSALARVLTVTLLIHVTLFISALYL